MHGNVPFGLASASELAARNCRESPEPIGIGKTLPPDGWFMRIVHGLWPIKTIAWLQSFTGFPERTCRSAGSGATEPSSAMLYVLLRGDAGWDILSGIMEGSEARWWTDIQRARLDSELLRKLVDEITKRE